MKRNYNDKDRSYEDDNRSSKRRKISESSNQKPLHTKNDKSRDSQRNSNQKSNTKHHHEQDNKSKSHEQNKNDKDDLSDDYLDEDVMRKTADKLRKDRLKKVEYQKKKEIGMKDDGDSDDFVHAGEADPDDDLQREEFEKSGVMLEPFNMDDEIRTRRIDDKGDFKRRHERGDDASRSEEDEYWLQDHNERLKNDPKYADENKRLVEKMKNDEMEVNQYQADVPKLLTEIADVLLWGV